MKLPLAEVERDPLLAELANWDGYVSSALLGVEAIRACARYGDEHAVRAREWLFDVSLLPLDDALLDLATSMEPAGLRSLDAIHLATALSVRDQIGALITYDDRLGTAAEGQGLAVLSP